MRRPWVVAAVSLVLLAGCGGDRHHPVRSVTVRAGQPLRVSAREYYFDPAKVVAGPGRLEVVLSNAGSLAHDIRITRAGKDVGGTPAFEGGRRTARVSLTKGRYRFLCTVGDHAKLGMVGTIDVR